MKAFLLALIKKIPPYLYSFLLGLITCFSFAPWEYFFLIWIVFALLADLIKNQKNSLQVIKISFSFATGFFLAGVSWIYVSLANVGGLPPVLAAMDTIIFCLFLAIFPTGAAYFYWKYYQKNPNNNWQSMLFFAASFTLAEIVRGYIFTGFPWLSIGYSQISYSQIIVSPLVYFAPIFGVYGVSFFTYFLATGLAEFYRIRQIRIVIFLVVLLIVAQLCSYINWSKPQGDQISVALVQGNIAQADKWQADQAQKILLQYWQLIKDNPAQITILPETALPHFYQQIPEFYQLEIEKLAARKNGMTIIGMPYGNYQQYWNALIGFSNQPTQIYAKQHLVPFGEFVPFGFAWFAAMTNIPFSNFQRGNYNKIFQWYGHKFAMTICYEDVFGEELIKAFPEANFIINSSNTAWFGDSLAQYQHLQIAQMRSIESARPSLRATNTGFTAIIDVKGKVTAKLDKFATGVLNAKVQGYQGVTPFMYYRNNAIILIIFMIFLYIWRSQGKSFNKTNQSIC